MTTLVQNPINASPFFQTSTQQEQPIRGYGYLVKYFNGKHPVDGKKYKAICFSFFPEKQSENKKALKEIIKHKKLAIINLNADKVTKLEINSKWCNDIAKKKVTEIVLIDSEGEYSLLRNIIDLEVLSSTEYAKLEEAQTQRLIK